MPKLIPGSLGLVGARIKTRGFSCWSVALWICKADADLFALVGAANGVGPAIVSVGKSSELCDPVENRFERLH